MEIEPMDNGVIDPKTLHLDPQNPNAMTAQQFEGLKESIKLYGILQSVVIDQDNNVIDGMNRTLAARELGMEAPYSRIKVKAHEDRRIIRQILNKLKGKHDPIKDAQEFVRILKANAEGKLFSTMAVRESEFYKGIRELGKKELEDIVPNPPKNAISKRGDVWELGNHRLVCEDSIKKETFALLMQNDKADLLLTDPPYGVSYADKNAYLNTISRGNRIQTQIKNDHEKPKDMYDLWAAVFKNCSDNMKSGANYYINAMQGGDLMMTMMQAILDGGLLLKHMIIWVKNNHVLGRVDYQYKHEPIFYGWKEGSHKFYGLGQTSVWNINKPHVSDLHPTMKPVELCERAILNSSREGELVLDAFAGAGSSLIASEKLRRKWRGIELDEKYCDVIVLRWEKYTQLPARLFRKEKEIAVGYAEAEKKGNHA